MDRTEQSYLSGSWGFYFFVSILVSVALFFIGIAVGLNEPTKIDAVTSDGDTTELTVSSDSLTRIPCGTTYIVKK